jgi:hypothetical protein
MATFASQIGMVRGHQTLREMRWRALRPSLTGGHLLLRRRAVTAPCLGQRRRVEYRWHHGRTDGGHIKIQKRRCGKACTVAS